MACGDAFGDLDVRKVHDDTLRPFVDARLAEGVSPNDQRTLEVVRAILNRAARAYRDADGFPWLETAPPLITMLPESPRLPHPINWDEQDHIFRRLADHLARMALFAVNTGLRDSNVCGLQWSWEVVIPELKRSVFVVLASEFKSRRAHVVILNDAAWSIIETTGTVRVSGALDRVKCEAAIAIADDGPGVPPEELPSIFEPFFRGETARAREGHGLGLAIARGVIEAHGGRLWAVNGPNGGLIVELCLPAACDVTNSYSGEA